MKRFLALVILLISTTTLFVACRPGSNPEGEQVEMTTLKNDGPAPELTNTVWLNTETPLRLAQLRGKVVLIDFWTFG